MQEMTIKKRREEVKAACERYGVSIYQQGQAFRIRSDNGVIDIMVVDLSWVQLDEINPNKPAGLFIRPPLIASE